MQKLLISSISAAVLLAFTSPVFSALPAPVPPQSGAGAGDWLGFVQGWADDAGTVIALIISMASFMISAWALVSKFNEARQVKRPYGGKRSVALGHWANIRTPKVGATEWGEVGLLAVVSGVLLIANVYFLNEAINII